MLRRTFFAVAIATLSALVGTAAAEAQAFTVTDVAGREVSFDKPVERVILGEGRQIYFVSVLDTEDPFKRVVGWRDDVRTADLVLAMARDHRREVVELDPSRMRQAFAAREFARLAADLSDDDLRTAAATAGQGAPPRERFAAALGAVAGRRGITLPPASPEDDDVIDPYGRSAATYERSAVELEPGLVAVERVVRIAFG